MTAYDPNNREHRRELASRIVADLDRLGFTRDPSRAGEAVYVRTREPGVDVLVYTSIVNGEVRRVGKDAIRVATVYTGGERPRCLGKETTIHRRGTIDSIADRIVERAGHALETGLDRCERCKAPAFESKAGNLVCAAICWERNITPVVAVAEPREPDPRPIARPTITVMSVRRSRSAPAAVDW